MFEEQTSQFSTLASISHAPHALSGENVATNTIDISSLFESDVHLTGSFDLRSIGSTSFGKLLNALPIPALVIDQWHHLVFVNQACERISVRADMVGQRFEQLLPSPSAADRAQILADKIGLLFERAFETRKPQTAEAILQLGEHRLWSRLHLRSVRMASQRHVLVIIEDLTGEKTQQILSQRGERQLRREHHELEKRFLHLKEEVERLQASLKREGFHCRQARTQAKAEREKFEALCNLAPVAIAVIGTEGSVKYANTRFRKLMCDQTSKQDDFPPDRSESGQNPAHANKGNSSSWSDILHSESKEDLEFTLVTITGEDGTPKTVSITTEKLSSGDYLVTCEDPYCPGA